MRLIETALIAAFGLVFFLTVGAFNPSSSVADPQNMVADTGLSMSSVLDLDDVVTNPDDYEWFDFRPNLKKLILSGAADTEHISILWYTTTDGGVGLHYHSMTESVYSINGTYTDDKGTQTTGSLTFNPPGSGHVVTDSTGFLILSYASPPDFVNTDLIEEYTPIQIDTTDPDLESIYPFKKKKKGVWVYDVPLDHQGGMSSAIIRATASKKFKYQGNYLLVLEGSCDIDGETFDEQMLVVATTVETQSYDLRAAAGSSCLALGLSF